MFFVEVSSPFVLRHRYCFFRASVFPPVEWQEAERPVAALPFGCLPVPRIGRAWLFAVFGLVSGSTLMCLLLQCSRAASDCEPPRVSRSPGPFLPSLCVLIQTEQVLALGSEPDLACGQLLMHLPTQHEDA